MNSLSVVVVLGVCLIEPHGDITHNVLARIPQRREKDIVHLDLMQTEFPFGLNLFDCANPANIAEVGYTHSFVTHVFRKLLGAGEQTPQLNRVLRNVTYTLIANPGTTFLEIQPLLLDRTVRDKLTANVTNPQVRAFWDAYERLSDAKRLELVASLLNRVDDFATNPLLQNIVGQTKTSIDFSAIMNTGKILLVQLPPRFEEIANLIGAVIIGKLLDAAYARKDLPATKRRQFHIYADEFQRFAVEDFAILFTEARKFKIGLTVAHQFRHQLDELNRLATLTVANIVVFRVTPEDATELVGRFDTTPEPAWEEEIEKEWVETLEKEWVETVGEEWVETIAEEWVETLEKERIEIMNLEVTDGTEPIKAISQSPLRFILNNSHGSNEVRELRSSLIADLGGFTPHSLINKDFSYYKDLQITDSDSGRMLGEKSSFGLLDNLLVYMMEHRQNINREYVVEKTTAIVIPICDQLGRGDVLDLHFLPESSDRLPYLHALVRTQYQFLETGERALAMITGAKKDIIDFLIKKDPHSLDPNWTPPGEGWDKYTAWYGTRVNIKEAEENRRRTSREKQQRLLEEVEAFTSLAKQFLRLCFALRDNPIYVATGQEQPRTRTQPHIVQHPRYTLVHPRQTLQHPRQVVQHPRQVLQHPRKTLLHPQRTYQDVSTQRASEISRLPNYTAKIRTGTSEQTIVTDVPGRGLKKADVQARKARVQEMNQRGNYIRARGDVEQEIKDRQDDLKQIKKRVAQTTSDEDE